MELAVGMKIRVQSIEMVRDEYCFTSACGKQAPKNTVFPFDATIINVRYGTGAALDNGIGLWIERTQYEILEPEQSFNIYN